MDIRFSFAGGGPVNGAILGVAGSAAAPSYSFSADPDTGMYRSAANTLDFATGGTRRMSIGSDGNVLINLNTGTPIAPNSAGLQVVGVTGTAARFHLDAVNQTPQIFTRAIPGSLSSPTAVQSAGSLGTWQGFGYKDTAISASAVRIGFFATQTWTDSATGTKITFGTTKNGTTTQTDRMTIDNDGSVGIGGASFGSGELVMFLANAVTNPSTNPTGGGVLYVNAGALTYRGSSGTVTVLGAA